MIKVLGEKFTDLFNKYMPSAYMFALLLTLLAFIAVLLFTDTTFIQTISSWYNGFWSLLTFGMQIVLIIITAYSIAQATIVKKNINAIAYHIKTLAQVYFSVMLLGSLLFFISFGMAVVVAIFARELALRVKGIHYPFLIA